MKAFHEPYTAQVQYSIHVPTRVTITPYLAELTSTVSNAKVKDFEWNDQYQMAERLLGI